MRDSLRLSGPVAALIILICGMYQPAAAMRAKLDLAEPAQAAIEYSRWEAEGRYTRLYRHMHSDARDIIPRDAVVGWYENDFGPLGPEVLAVTGVSFVSWTWPVTGEVYQETAEVSFRQPFADGTVVDDVIRLVEEDGEWRWFFGRSREFVDEQITRYVREESRDRRTSNEVTDNSSGRDTSGPVSLEVLEERPIRNRNLPDGMSLGEVTAARVGRTDGPLFGLLNDDLGASWLNIEIESREFTVYMQYAVFSTSSDAEEAYQSSAIRGQIGTGNLGDDYVIFEDDPIFDVDALVWIGATYNAPTSNRLERYSMVAGGVSRSHNVLVFTFVATGPQLGTPPEDFGQVVVPAYNLIEAAVRYVDTMDD